MCIFCVDTHTGGGVGCHVGEQMCSNVHTVHIFCSFLIVMPMIYSGQAIGQLHSYMYTNQLPCILLNFQ